METALETVIRTTERIQNRPTLRILTHTKTECQVNKLHVRCDPRTPEILSKFRLTEIAAWCGNDRGSLIYRLRTELFTIYDIIPHHIYNQSDHFVPHVRAAASWD